MTEQGNERPVEVPEDKAGFNEVLKKFRIGLKGDFYETITDDIATTGGELVFETPELLMKKLGEWHTHVDPPTRRKIIEYWFAKKGTPVPEEVVTVAGMTETQKQEEEKKKVEEVKREAAESKKYIVNSETGAITVAKRDDRPALDWDEAVTLSTRIKGERGETGEKESPFILDKEGNITVNPKAKLGGMEVLAYDALSRAQTKGETRTPLEILEEDAKRIETIRAVFGGSKEGKGLLDSVDDLTKLKTLLGADEDTKALLSGIYKRVSEAGTGKEENEGIKALREELKALREEQDREKWNRVTAELAGVKGELAKARDESKAKNEYGIMDKALAIGDKRLGAIENLLVSRFGSLPPPMPPGEKQQLTEGVVEVVAGAEELDQLAESVFYGKG